MHEQTTERQSRPHAMARRSAAIFALGLITLVLGCSSQSSSSSDSSPTALEPAGAETPTFFNPLLPVTATVGREFAIMLPADPGSGWRWVLTPIDNTRLIALGSYFSDDTALLAQAAAVTTTTTTTIAAARPTAPSVPPDTAVTPAVLPLVQIISFAGRSAGSTALTFQYTQIAGTPEAQNTVVTFSVQIVPEVATPTLPPTSSTTLSIPTPTSPS
ncbi:MAG: hypothetical protein WEA11_08505 [Acidimicrobiales bacterium]